MSRTTARALSALAALVLGLLVCATGVTGAGPGPVDAFPVVRPSAASGSSGVAVATAASRPSAVPVATAGPVPGAVVPGCEHGSGTEAGADAPAVPPRTPGFAELLPVLAAGRAGCAPFWGADPGARFPVPGRASPELVPPSPVELSVLRV